MRQRVLQGATNQREDKGKSGTEGNHEAFGKGKQQGPRTLLAGCPEGARPPFGCDCGSPGAAPAEVEALEPPEPEGGGVDALRTGGVALRARFCAPCSNHAQHAADAAENGECEIPPRTIAPIAVEVAVGEVV